MAEQIIFPPFQLDLQEERLWQAPQVLDLRPKACAILRYLVEHAGHVVTKEEPLEAV